MSNPTLVVINPMNITSSMLIDSNVPEDDYPVWQAPDTFTKGDRTILLSTHKVYESLEDANIGNNPSSSPEKWLEVGATNRWRAFDKSISSQTAQAGSITYTIKPGRAIPYLGALNIKGATSMSVRVVDPVYGEVYSRDIPLSRIPVAVGWWAWYFGERSTPTQAIFSGMPAFPAADIFIEIRGSDDLAVGAIIIGQERSFSLGVKTGARVGIEDYSDKGRNQFGDVIIVERPFAKRASFSMRLLASEVDSFNDFLASVRATPCLWIGSDRYESTTIYGFYKSFDIIISGFHYSDAELELEGLT